MIHLFKFHFTFTPTIQPQLSAAPRPGLSGGEERPFELITPAPDAVLQDLLGSSSTSIRAIPRPGNWYPSIYDEKKDSEKKVVLYFFGGAYVLGSHVPRTYTGTLDKLLPALGYAKLFSVGYRLASKRGNHFPAQLIDAVSAYHHILDKGIRPSQVILLGDSAGGNLVPALLRYIVESTELLPLPAAACVAHPWLDLSSNLSGLYQHPNARYDIISSRLWVVNAFIPPEFSALHRHVSPSRHPFAIPIPVWIEADEKEIFCDSIIKFATEMKAMPMNDIEIHIQAGGTHATLMLGTIMGFQGLVDRAVGSIRLFLLDRKLLT